MKVEKISQTHVRFTFDVTPDEFEHALGYAFDKVKKDISVKGFRKGHVPRNIYENKFGVESLYEDALNHVVHHKSHEALDYEGFEIVAQPKVELDFEAVKRDDVFQIALVAPVKPEVSIASYKGIEVKKVDTEVTDAMVEKEIDALLKKNSQLEPKEGVIEEGDTAIFDFEGFLEGVPFEGGKAENYSLEIGSGQFIPGFEAQMIGMAKGEAKDLNVTFPEAYQAENLAGKPVVFKVVLHEIKRKLASELNDAFVLSLNQENVKTVEELRNKTKDDLEAKKNQEAKTQYSESVLSYLIENNPFDVPEEMIEEEVKVAKQNVADQAKRYGMEMDMFLQLSGVDQETFEKQIHIESKRRVQTTLIIEQIAKDEKIEVSPEEIVLKFEELSKQYNMPIEEIKKYIPEYALKNDIALNKAYQLVIDASVKV